MVLIGELRVARGRISPLLRILSRGPIIPPYEPGYMPVHLGPVGGWGPFAQTQGPSQDRGYIPGASGRASPSTSLLNGNDDDDDANQFISDSFRNDDSQ